MGRIRDGRRGAPFIGGFTTQRHYAGGVASNLKTNFIRQLNGI
jgi:hypothetical protein